MTTIDLFQHSGDALSFSAGTTIFSEGDQPDYAYVVIKGEVELVVNGTGVETVGPGGIFGEMALIEQKPRIASAIAGTDCRIVSIDERQFMFLVHVTPNLQSVSWNSRRKTSTNGSNDAGEIDQLKGL
jgi:CRP/FNR family transcriptional regulator, cyclic AMP receptor protein